MPVTNWGDKANVIVALNEQVLLARHRLDALEDDAIILARLAWMFSSIRSCSLETCVGCLKS